MQFLIVLSLFATVIHASSLEPMYMGFATIEKPVFGKPSANFPELDSENQGQWRSTRTIEPFRFLNILRPKTVGRQIVSNGESVGSKSNIDRISPWNSGSIFEGLENHARSVGLDEVNNPLLISTQDKSNKNFSTSWRSHSADLRGFPWFQGQERFQATTKPDNFLSTNEFVRSIVPQRINDLKPVENINVHNSRFERFNFTNKLSPFEYNPFTLMNDEHNHLSRTNTFGAKGQENSVITENVFSRDDQRSRALYNRHIFSDHPAIKTTVELDTGLYKSDFLPSTKTNLRSEFDIVGGRYTHFDSPNKADPLTDNFVHTITQRSSSRDIGINHLSVRSDKVIESGQKISVQSDKKSTKDILPDQQDTYSDSYENQETTTGELPKSAGVRMQFYSYSAPEEEEKDPSIELQISKLLKKNYNLVFLNNPLVDQEYFEILKKAQEALKPKAVILMLSPQKPNNTTENDKHNTELIQDQVSLNNDRINEAYGP